MRDKICKNSFLKWKPIFFAVLFFYLIYSLIRLKMDIFMGYFPKYGTNRLILPDVDGYIDMRYNKTGVKY